MSDLIDLSSPDSKGILGPKLTSPLISTSITFTNLNNCETNLDSDALTKIPEALKSENKRTISSRSYSELSSNNDETEIKSIIQQGVSMCIQKSTLDVEKFVKPSVTLKPLLHRRSLSQGANRSPRKRMEANGRSHSILDTLKLGVPSSDNTALSLPSIVIDDTLNDGFLRNSSGSTSAFSILSNISGISKANSLSQNHSSFLSGLSDGTMNCAFLRSSNSERFDSTKSGDKIDSFSLPELSNSVTDSVFTEEHETSQLILHEAKALAETFDDLAHRVDSRSSTGKLFLNNPSWMSELLPAFDIEPVIEDLIVLPTSPEANTNQEKLNHT